MGYLENLMNPQAQAQFAMQQGLLQKYGMLDGGAAPTQNTQLASAGPTAPGMSANASQLALGSPDYATAPAAPASAPQQPQFPLNPAQIGMMHLAGMPDLTGAYNASQPSLQVHNGVMFDSKSGKTFGFMPQTNQQGFSTLTVGDPANPASWQVRGVNGAPDQFRQQQRIQNEEGARYQVHPSNSPLAALPFRPSAEIFPDSQALLLLKLRCSLTTQPAPQPMKADPWSSVPKLPTPMGIGQTTYQRNLDETRAKYAGTLSDKYGGMAEAADQRIALNNQALELVDKADTGPGAAGQAEVKSWLMKFAGIPEV
jgi:hypothetical protein